MLVCISNQHTDYHFMIDWISIKDKKPENYTRVDAMYEGVYEGARIRRNILYWEDGVNSHFGWFSEVDGKGSQPATHWRKAL